MWSQQFNRDDERKSAAGHFGGGPSPQQHGLPGGYQQQASGAPPVNPPPPPRGGPPPQANSWAPPPPQQTRSSDVHAFYGHDGVDEDDDGALGATINLVTSAASMFFKPPTAPAPAPPPVQQTSPGPNGPPPPIDPTTSMLDLDPVQPSPPVVAQQAGFVAPPTPNQNNMFRPPSHPHPSTPLTERVTQPATVFASSPRLVEPSSPRVLAESSPKVAQKFAHPQIAVPHLPSLPTPEERQQPTTSFTAANTLPPLRANPVSNLVNASNVFGSTPSTLASSAANNVTPSFPAVQTTVSGSMDAADVFGNGPIVTLGDSEPPAATATAPPVTEDAPKPEQATITEAPSQAQPSPSISRPPIQPSSKKTSSTVVQRETPPPSPKTQQDVQPTSPKTPLMTNQTSSTTKAKKITASSPLPTPTRRHLRAPPKKHGSPRTTTPRPKFRLPPPRMTKKVSPSPRKFEKPPAKTSPAPSPSPANVTSPAKTEKQKLTEPGLAPTPHPMPQQLSKEESVTTPSISTSATETTSTGPSVIPSMEHDRQKQNATTVVTDVAPTETCAPEVTTISNTISNTADSTEPFEKDVLPEGWKEIMDTSAGTERIYYYNAITQKTSWDRPTTTGIATAEKTIDDATRKEVKSDVPFAHKNEVQTAPSTAASEEQNQTASDGPTTFQQKEANESASTSSAAVVPSNDATCTNAAPETEISRSESIDSIFDDLNAEFDCRDKDNKNEDNAATVESETVDDAKEEDSHENATLPPDWVEAVDVTSGRTYYYNSATQETFWEKPSLSGEPNVEVETVGNAEGLRMSKGTSHVPSETKENEGLAEGSLAENWMEMTDQFSGRMYYYNAVTQETSWEKPSAAPEPANAASDQAVQETSIARDISTPSTVVEIQVPLEVDHKTEILVQGIGTIQSSEDKEHEKHQEESELPTAGTENGDVMGPNATADLANWVEMIDESSGNKYYFNSITQETTWEKPVSMPQAETIAGGIPINLSEDSSPAAPIDEAEPAPIPLDENGVVTNEPEQEKPVEGSIPISDADNVNTPELPINWVEGVDESSGRKYYYNVVTQETSWEIPMTETPEADAPIDEMQKSEIPENVQLEDTAVARDEGRSYQNNEPEKVQLAAPNESADDGTALPLGWTLKFDEAMGMEFYFNETTNETSWEKPIESSEANAPGVQPEEHAAPPVSMIPPDEPEKVEPTAIPQESAQYGVEVTEKLPGDWIEMIDDASGQKYFYNSNTEKTTWNFPSSTLDVGIPPDSPPAEEAEEKESPAAKDNSSDVAEDPNTEHEQVGASIRADATEESRESDDIPLPEFWVEAVDDSNGRTYYYNTITQETSWERPPSSTGEAAEFPMEQFVRGSEESSSAEVDIPPVDKVDIPGNETEKEDKTKQVDSMAANPVEIAPDELPDDWIEAVDESSRQNYYYNTATQETSWERPQSNTLAPQQPEDESVIGKDTEDTAAKPATEPAESSEDSSASSASSSSIDVSSTSEGSSEGLEGETADDSLKGTAEVQAGLPPYWEEVVDESSGQVYYFNSATRETSWDIPESPSDTRCGKSINETPEEEMHVAENDSEEKSENAEAQSPTEESGALEEAEDSLPPDWIEAVDESSGNAYYYNTTTQETSWEKPAIPVAMPESSSEPCSDEVFDGHETSPSQLPVTDEDQILEESAPEEAAIGRELPENWEKVVHESSGEVYYYNAKTQETSWDRPGLKEVGDNTEPLESAESGSTEDDLATTGEEGPNSTEEEVAATTYNGQLPEDWKEIVDESSGQVYYYNRVTEETSWERPLLLAAEDDSMVPCLADEVAVPAAEQDKDLDTPMNESATGTTEEDEESVAPAEDALIPENWEKVVNETSDQVYYYNSVTKGTSWTKPEHPEEATYVAQSQSEQAPAALAHDKAEESENDLEEEDSAVSNSHVGLAMTWEEAVDESSGQVYYYNTATQETSWEKPPFPADDGTGEEQSQPLVEQKSAEVEESEVAESLPGTANEASGLGEWEEVVDESSGQVYYYNSVTEETSWEKPNLVSRGASENQERTHAPIVDDVVEEGEEETPPVEEDHEPPASVADSGLPENWEEIVDESSGQIYYYNNATEETSIERPRLASEIPDTNLDQVNTAASSEDIPESSVVDEDPVAPECDGVLPEDWAKIVDDSSGQVYYYNAMTQETSWEKPEVPTDAPGIDSVGDENLEQDDAVVPREDELLVGAEEKDIPEPVASDNDGDDDLPCNWEKIVDDFSGQVYYYNGVTQETAWEKPENPAEALEADPSYGEEVAPETTQNEHATAGEESPPPSEDAKAPTSGDNEGLSENWEEHVDESNGQVYYYNVVTLETSWSKPEACPDLVSTDTADEGKTIHLEDSAADADKVPVLEEEEEEDHQEAAGLPEDWEEVVDESSGQVYYFNAVTQETSWDRPGPATTNGHLEPVAAEEQIIEEQDFVAEEIPGRAVDEPEAKTYDNGLPEGWEELVDDTSGQTYYYNATTEQTSWERPSKFAVVFSEYPAEEEQLSEPAKAAAEQEPAIYTGNTSKIEDEPVVPSQDSRLPDNWEEVVDESSGQVYYYNIVSEETSWEKPQINHLPANEATILLERTGNAGDVGDSSYPTENVSNGNTAEQWVQKEDESSGQTNDYNTATQKTSWENPVSDLKELVNDSLPTECDPDTVANEASAATNERSNGELPQGWIEAVEESSGQIYYYNTVTQETSWDKPAEPSVVPDGAKLTRGESGDHFVDEYDMTIKAEDKKDAVDEEGFVNEFDLTTDDDVDDDVDEDYDMVPNIDEKQEDEPTKTAEAENDYALPEFWTEATDDATGKKYYYNTLSQEVSWKPPKTAKEQPSEAEKEDEPTVESTEKTEETVDSTDDAPSTGPSDSKAPEGWTKVMDGSSGSLYYYNESTGATSWEPPDGHVDKKDAIQEGWVELETDKVGEDIGKQTADESASDSKIGETMRSILLVEPEISQSVDLEKALVGVEKQRAECDICGPLISSSDSSVMNYISMKKDHEADDILWHLIAIAASSNGILRSAEGVIDRSSPEASIVELLLRDESTSSERTHLPSPSSRKIVVEQDPDEIDDAQIAMERIQKLLLQGERRQAVEEAISKGDFATAFLVASMCDPDTYKRVANAYAERAFVAGSPMQTVCLMFSESLQTSARAQNSHWGIASNELNSTWKKHLAVIISNRAMGWVQVVLSLGDRLRQIGNIAGAHFCFMVCGCAFTNATAEDTRIALLGCDNIPRESVALLSSESVAAFDRTEAYEWAKRRGNRNATIQSFLPHKLIYAMHLTDIGLQPKSVAFAETIRKSVPYSSNDTNKGIRVSLKDVFSERAYLCTALSELESTLGVSRPDMVGVDQVPTSTSRPSIARSEPEHDQTNEVVGDNDESFLTARTNLMEKTGYTLDTPERHPRGSENVKADALPMVAPIGNPISSVPVVLGPPTTSTPEIRERKIISELIDTTTAPSPSGTKKTGPPFMGMPTGATDSPALANESRPPARTVPASSKTTIVNQTPTQPPDSQAANHVPMTPNESNVTSSKPKSPPATAPPVMMGKKAEKRSSKKAPSSSDKAPSSGSSWNLGIRNWMIKKFNPDATACELPHNEEKAYYDKKLGVWVFPGDDPAELAKPVAPPPIISAKKESAPAPAPPPSNDPLAQLMAPPPTRGISSARRPGGRPRGMPSPGAFPGMPGMATASPGGASTPGGVAAPPTFAVFQPKPATTDDTSGSN